MSAHDPWCEAVRELREQVTVGAILDGGCPVCDLIARTFDDLRVKVLDLPRGRDRESGAWCIEVDALLALLEGSR